MAWHAHPPDRECRHHGRVQAPPPARRSVAAAAAAVSLEAMGLVAVQVSRPSPLVAAHRPSVVSAGACSPRPSPSSSSCARAARARLASPRLACSAWVGFDSSGAASHRVAAVGSCCSVARSRPLDQGSAQKSREGKIKINRLQRNQYKYITESILV